MMLRAGCLLVLGLISVHALSAQTEGFAGRWLPADWDGKKSIIAGITAIDIIPLQEGFSVVVYWISQGWPTRFRGQAVEEKGSLMVKIETTNHGNGREELWTRDEKGNLTAWGKKFIREKSDTENGGL